MTQDNLREVLQATGDEVEILRALLRWSEQKATSTYSSVKQHEYPVVGTLLTATESVAKRVNATGWLGSLYGYVDPVAAKIDQTLSRHVLSTLSLLLQANEPSSPTTKSRSIHVVPRGVPVTAPVADEVTKELQLELETLRSVLRMIRQENQGLRHLEMELEVLRSTLQRFHDENEELLQANTAAKIKTRHLESEIETLQAAVAAARADATAAANETSEAKARAKALEADVDALRASLESLRQTNATLQQELIDVHTYRASKDGQTVADLEALLAESNVQNALLEAENKQLKVARARGSSGAQKQKHLARTQSMNMTGL
ncbi:hypothetical protein SPRG_22183 [Saprolegnia parasitica CBS 223.65]|uniref:Uncharacterized protein n=1 Tax=Saprolegnia parasitica (strain CBS 223.65) TaxID=695850 RepID=A0A067CEM8_SAPPC|nr:hypothetical protein SPRG_22183 [Saprolegnia parasitica CBS 223.65]KDO28968.1 hypothetical protein SPRG_22183 [Saprolegnia parasitica CBS 223.65]|eukprot:XP_012200347.1 hypothetical protein SPRG_22183 [Saprolegnia parasitica CBS 223.65]